jgi:hypothetical protein
LFAFWVILGFQRVRQEDEKRGEEFQTQWELALKVKRWWGSSEDMGGGIFVVDYQMWIKA